MITALAKHMGMNIIDVVRRSAQKEELLKLGCVLSPLPPAPSPPCLVFYSDIPSAGHGNNRIQGYVNDHKTNMTVLSLLHCNMLY